MHGRERLPPIPASRCPLSSRCSLTSLPLFATSPSQPNDIPEGGTGELWVAMATGRQQASEHSSA